MTAIYQEPPSGGGGVTTYQGLTDAQDYAISEALKEVRVNAAGGGLLFGRPKYYINYFGAVNDGQEVSDGSISSGTNVLNSAEGLFASSDVGKPIIITGAGASGAQLSTTIAGYTSATQVTLTVAASSTVSNSQVSWGTDNTAAIQLALDTAALARGGKVIVPIGRWLCTGVLDFKRLPDGVNITRSSVTFEGEVSGPFESRSGPLNFSPGRYPLAPCLMITNTSNHFLSFNALNVIVNSLMFYYPNQIRCNSSGTIVSTTTTPVAYPFTVDMTYLSAGCHMVNCTFSNSYDAVRAYGGRHIFNNIFMGNLRKGFEIDRALDVIKIQNIHGFPSYDLLGGYGGVGGGLQPFVHANSICLLVYRADQLMLNNLFWYACSEGISLQNGAYGNSYGCGSNIEFDFCKYALRAENTSSTGWDFTNFGAAGILSGGGVTCFEFGSGSPAVTINGGKIYGSFANKVTKASGNVNISNVRNYNPTGELTAPSMPASNVEYVNAFPHICRVYVSGGTVTVIKHRTSGVPTPATTGLTSGTFILYPNDGITITYSAAPTWVWFGM